jgi:hypothetical protein
MQSVLAGYWSDLIILFGYYSWIDVYNSRSIYLDLLDAGV